ncbi:MAG: peptidoglycan-binding domain-containing protein, partial [Patescibacteria group bacterium]
MYLRNAKLSKIVASVIGFSMVLSVAFTGIPANAQTAAELQAQIQSLLATITALQGQLATLGGGTTGACTFTFTQALKQGSTGSEVMNLQKFLNKSADTQVSTTGAGSPGNESSYFGPATKAAVMKFQTKYASEVLTPLGLSGATGFWGVASRAKANAMCSVVVVPPPGTPPPAATGTSLMVAAGTQPAATLAPEGASNVPFTKFTLTAGTDGAVAVNGVTVQRVGLGSNSVFSGVVLLDDMGNIMDVDKTLNANNQATIGGIFTVPAGTTKTYTVAGNMLAAGELTGYAGQVIGINVVAINT